MWRVQPVEESRCLPRVKQCRVFLFFSRRSAAKMDLHAWLQSGKRPATSAPATPTAPKQAKQDEVDVTPVPHFKAEKLVAMEEFKDQCLEAREDEVYCRVCKTGIPLEPRVLRQHCFKKQTASAWKEFTAKSEESKVKLHHYSNLVMLDRARTKAAVLRRAIERTARLGCAKRRDQWRCGRT